VRRGPTLAAGLLAGTALDALVGDPRRGHPVAVFGQAASMLEHRVWRDSRTSGVLFAAGCVGAAVSVGARLERAAGPRGYSLVVALATWTVLGSESLRREAHALHDLLVRHELAAARERLTHLVGRDTSSLDESGIARAAVESVAENSSDAVVAPLMWGALAGLPGLLGYRAVNTLDAMVGHRSVRYRRFGWASARLDDLANLVPARATAALVALVSARPREVLLVVRRDARRHPSPNSGWCEAAFAGALGLRLGGLNSYGGRVEQRPALGDGRPARAADLPRAARLNARVTLAAALAAAAVAIAAGGRR